MTGNNSLGIAGLECMIPLLEEGTQGKSVKGQPELEREQKRPVWEI